MQGVCRGGSEGGGAYGYSGTVVVERERERDAQEQRGGHAGADMQHSSSVQRSLTLAQSKEPALATRRCIRYRLDLLRLGWCVRVTGHDHHREHVHVGMELHVRQDGMVVLGLGLSLELGLGLGGLDFGGLDRFGRLGSRKFDGYDGGCNRRATLEIYYIRNRSSHAGKRL
jgi:hypothetical protein